MKFRWPMPLILMAVWMVPRVAEAHLVTTGLGPFYDGVMHLVLSPDDVLGLLAAALLAGLRGPRAGRWLIAVLPTSWLIGAVMGLSSSGVPAWQFPSVLSFIVLGLFVALDCKLSVAAVGGITGCLGFLHGFFNGVALQQVDAGVLNVLGIVTTVFVVALLVSACVVTLRSEWARVAVRVAGSWVVAVGLLMMGWMFRGAA